MKKLFCLFAFAFTILTAQATVVQTIWTVADSGNAVYITKSATNAVSTVATFALLKPVNVNTQSGYLYIKDLNGVIYSLKVGTDSITIDGIVPQGANAAAKLTAAAAKVRAMNRQPWKAYYSTVATVATVKTGRGVIHTLTVDSVGAGGQKVITIWDGTDTSTTGTRIGSYDITATRNILIDAQFQKSLYLKQKTVTAGKVTITYYLRDPYEDSFWVPSNDFPSLK